jgi:hypothetical protein
LLYNLGSVMDIIEIRFGQSGIYYAFEIIFGYEDYRQSPAADRPDARDNLKGAIYDMPGEYARNTSPIAYGQHIKDRRPGVAVNYICRKARE